MEVTKCEQAWAWKGRDYRGWWVIRRAQPFSPLAKELLEPQAYPDLRQFPNGPPIRPYDVAGWTLPMQMGVEVATISQPLSASQRASLKRIEQVTPPAGGVQGTGAAFVLSHQSNASFAALNEILKSGGQASFSKAEMATPGGTENGAIIVSVRRV